MRGYRIMPQQLIDAFGKGVEATETFMGNESRRSDPVHVSIAYFRREKIMVISNPGYVAIAGNSLNAAKVASMLEKKLEITLKKAFL